VDSITVEAKAFYPAYQQADWTAIRAIWLFDRSSIFPIFANSLQDRTFLIGRHNNSQNSSTS